MMFKPTRESSHSVDPTLSDVIFQAHREGRTVEITNTDQTGMMVEIDGVEVAPIASESFDWPLRDIEIPDEASALVEAHLDRRRKRRFERRKQRLSTKTHTAAEGHVEI